MLMANAVRDMASRVPGKEAMAIEAYSNALSMVCIVRNGLLCYINVDLLKEFRIWL